MHDIKWIRDNPDAFDRSLARRGLRPQSKELIALDEQRRKTIHMVELWQEKRNRLSKEIGAAKKAKDESKASELMAEVSRLKSDITHAGEQVITRTEKQLNDLLAGIPNLPLPEPEVPTGRDETANVEHHHFGAKRNYPFQPKQHFELGEDLRQMDFETAAKLSGARFVVLKSGLARMERAIGQFFVDVHTSEHGYTEIAPPLLVRDEVMFGTGQLPKFEEDQFSAYREVSLRERIDRAAIVKHQEFLAEQLKEDHAFSFPSPPSAAAHLFADVDAQPLKDRLWLIPTAEVPLTNMVRESIVHESELPMRLTAYTPCFRAEAGAAGKDTRGMIRQHQFNKVELVSITTPEESKNEHERMLSCAEEVLRRLGLHYRVVTLCTGDMGFASQKTYDIEVWLPGQGAYREISSCSNCGDFQARRMSARFRGKEDRTPRFVHTLNGSGVAVGRALVAVMENYQQEGGSIAVPDVLQGYMGGKKVIEKAA
jgi:seryl-tRNA synthetase